MSSAEKDAAWRAELAAARQAIAETRIHLAEAGARTAAANKRTEAVTVAAAEDIGKKLRAERSSENSTVEEQVTVRPIEVGEIIPPREQLVPVHQTVELVVTFPLTVMVSLVHASMGMVPLMVMVIVLQLELVRPTLVGAATPMIVMDLFRCGRTWDRQYGQLSL